MPGPTRRRRLLFIHAHPDDETLTTGLTMAHYRAAGHDVHVLTCTLGEEGEVIPTELRHLTADRDGTLAPTRREELRRAMAVLDVSHAVLGEDPARGVLSRYRDSGMAGTPGAAHPDAFVGADLEEAAGLVADHLRRLQPDVVVTYDEHGGYGHPDHIQTHRVTMAALRSLADEAPTAYGVLTPQSWACEDRDWLAAHVDAHIAPPLAVLTTEAPFSPSVVDDAVVTHAVEDPGQVGRQAAALACHVTQVRVFDGYYALSNHLAARLSGREGFAVLDPATGRPCPAADVVPGASSGATPARHTGLLPDEAGA